MLGLGCVSIQEHSKLSSRLLESRSSARIPQWSPISMAARWYGRLTARICPPLPRSTLITWHRFHLRRRHSAVPLEAKTGCCAN